MVSTEPGFGAWRGIRLLNPNAETSLKVPHLLLVTPYYWPEIAASVQLMATLSEGLSERRFRVTVLTSSTREPIPTYAEDGVGNAHNVRIIRAWNPLSRRSGIFNKLFEFAWFFLTVAIRGFTVRKIDVIFVSSSPPLAALPVAILGFIKRAPVVYNLQDLFPESAVASGLMSRTGLAFKFFSRLESWCYASSDLVIAINESFIKHVLMLYPSCRTAIIPNWVDTEEMVCLPKAENKFLPLFPGSDFIVLYAGNLGFLQNLDLLLDAAKLLQDEKGIRFVLVGNGNQRLALVDRAQRENLANCVFMDFQPYDLLAHVYSACDIGVVPMRPGAGTSSIPSKTWNYLACSKPVIACVDEDSPFAHLVRESRSGTVVSPVKAEGLAQAILQFYRSPNSRQECGESGRRYVVDNLSQNTAIECYAREIRKLLG